MQPYSMEYLKTIVPATATPAPMRKWFSRRDALLLLTMLLTLMAISGSSTRATSDFLPKVNCVSHDTKFTCDCGNQNEAMLLPHLVGFVYQVEISNCKSLSIEANSLEETQGLRKLTFRNIENLVLNKYALSFPKYASNTPLVIEFQQVNFELIDSHAINGNIEEISFIGGRIQHIQPFGFSTLKEQSYLLKMDNVLVQRIEPQAFKKFSVQELEIINCVFEMNVPSKAFYELEVLSVFRLQNVRFKYVHTRAFSFKLIQKLTISNNHFEGIDAEWLEALARDTVTIRENHFGTTMEISFKGIGVHRDYQSSEPLQLNFINNTVHFAQEPRALEFNSVFRITVQQLYYDNAIDCQQTERTQQQSTEARIVFFQKNSDNIFFLSNNTSKTTTRLDHYSQSYKNLSKIVVDCQETSYVWLYILIGACILSIILIVIAIILYVYYAKKRKRRKMDVVLPEPRTYKETQIVYQIENAGLLKTDF